jgi:hypothetical protein
MLPSAVFLAIHEADGLPVVVDRRTLVVDKAGVEADLLHGVEVQVGLELRGLLRPGDPAPVRRCERLLQGGDRALELGPPCRDEDDDLGARLGAELLCERGFVSLL